MTTKKAAIAKVTGTDEACALIEEWFQRTNRPVTAQALTDALGSRVRKPLVQKTLDDLLERQQLQCKDLKKVRFFFLRSPTAEATPGEPIATGVTSTRHFDNTLVTGAEDKQAADDNGEEREEEADPTRERKAELVEQIMAMRAQVNGKTTELTQLLSIPTSDERRLKLLGLTSEIEALCASVARAQSTRSAHDGGGAAPLDVDALVASYQDSRSLWRERKEFATRLIDGVLGETCSLAELSEMFAIVTDEAAGTSFRETALTLPRAPGARGFAPRPL